MYVWEYIDQDELTRLIPAGTGTVGMYSVIDQYIMFFVDTINDRLLQLKADYPKLGKFQLVYEKKTDLNTAVSLKIYCYDFHIEATTANGDFVSRGYRIQVKITSSGAKAANIGIRMLPTNPEDKLMWKGERLSSASAASIARGDFSIFSGYNISAAVAIAQKTPKGGFIEGRSADKRRLVRGKAYLLVTENNLCIFTHKDKYPGNIISFLMFRHVIHENQIMYLANGWRCDSRKITLKTKRDKYFQSSKPNKPNVKPDLWMREIWLTDNDGADIRWFLPNVYNTNEHRLQSSLEMEFRHVNQSVGLQEERQAINVLCNTFMTSGIAVLSFV